MAEALIDGLRFSFETLGALSGEPIIFLHAFPLDQRMWRPQIEPLKAGYRLYTYDYRGLGRSEAGNIPFTLEFLVDDLFGLMDHWKLQKAILCGLSMGGYVALRAIERAPERVLGLVLCDTRSEADSNEAKLNRARAIRSVTRDGVAAFSEGFIKSAVAPQTLAHRPEAVAALREIILRQSPNAVAGALVALISRTDTTANLAKVRVPTLIIVGERDALTPPALGLAMKERIPGAAFETVPQAGHFSNLENPAAFNEVLLQFLRARFATTRL